MSCSISIDVNATVAYHEGPGAPPFTIHVRGTAEGCNVVDVQLQSIQSAVVSAPVIDGIWVAIFNAPAHFDTQNAPCGTANIKVRAECQDAACSEEGEILSLACLPRDCPTEAVIVVYEAGDPSAVVNPAQCLPAGLYTVSTADPQSATATYQWSLNGITQGAVSGPGQTEFELQLEDGDDPQSVSVVIAFSLDCLLSAATTLTVCPPVSPDCPDSVVLEVSQGGGDPVDPQEGCLEPGTWTVRVTEPVGDATTYSWSLDNDLQQGSNSSSLDVELTAGAAVVVQVSAVRDGCAVVPGSVELQACPPAPNCPDELVRHVETADGKRLSGDEECVPAGSYTVVVDEPVGPGVEYVWRMDDEPLDGEDGPALSVVVQAGQTVVVEVEARPPNCTPLREKTELNGCEEEPVPCPENVDLVVRDASGESVDAEADCLPSGTYEVEVQEPSGPGVTRSWSRDGELQPGITGPVIDVELGTGDVVDVAVSVTRDDCRPVPAGVTLKGCERPGRPPDGRPPAPWWCPILFYSGLVSLLVGLVLIFGGMCSSNPIGWVIAGIGGGLAATGFVLLVAWALLCAPARGGCDLLARLMALLSVLTILLGIVAAIFVAIAVICGLITSPTGWLAALCGLPGACGVGAVIDLGIVGVLLAILALIYLWLDC